MGCKVAFPNAIYILLIYAQWYREKHYVGFVEIYTIDVLYKLLISDLLAVNYLAICVCCGPLDEMILKRKKALRIDVENDSGVKKK